MKTVTVASAKGGSGKSTLVSALAARATFDTVHVAMMDLNFDQASLTNWWHVRRSPMWPRLISDVENIPRAVRKLAAKGRCDFLFIDTPPANMDLIEQSIAVADAVLIPVRSGFFDIMAVQPVIEMAKERRKPFAFVLNAVDGRFKILTKQTAVALEDMGPTLKTHMSYRQPYIHALLAGKTGPEIDKDLKPEIDNLWSEVRHLAETGRVQ
jgi:chromosome partitioning protein